MFLTMLALVTVSSLTQQYVRLLQSYYAHHKKKSYAYNTQEHGFEI
jgi:hypothetical protein